MVGLGTRFAIERAEIGNSRPKAARASALPDAVYVFRNRSATALKFVLYDGQGYWLMMKRLSQGRFAWWPQTLDARVPLSARELVILIWNGDPERAQMAQDWRRVA